MWRSRPDDKKYPSAKPGRAKAALDSLNNENMNKPFGVCLLPVLR